MNHTSIFGAALIALGLIAGTAQANSVTIAASTFSPGKDFSVTCDASCEGLIGAAPLATWSSTNADGYAKPGNPTDELKLLNSLLGLSGPAAIAGSGDIDDDGTGFNTGYQYFGIKKGGWIAYFQNTSGGAVDVAFKNAAGTSSAEYSHVTGFGTVVPIPAAVWLFGSALLGIAGIGYRRQTKGTSDSD